jgi:D-glycero-D-manno-heptose 1,7-bisphosphate phosphatase
MGTPGTATGASSLPVRRAVFVDRDGTLNPDLRYLAEAERLEVFKGVGDGLRWLRQHGYVIVCVTNQSGIERGFYTAEDVDRIHRRLNDRLSAVGAHVDAFYYCPHAPEAGCDCRKPGTRLFELARDEWDLQFAGSAIIGDRALDVEAGERLGLVTAVVHSPGHAVAIERELRAQRLEPDIRALSFAGAARRLLARR